MTLLQKLSQELRFCELFCLIFEITLFFRQIKLEIVGQFPSASRVIIKLIRIVLPKSSYLHRYSTRLDSKQCVHKRSNNEPNS
jgi:hypothetical protein